MGSLRALCRLAFVLGLMSNSPAPLLRAEVHMKSRSTGQAQLANRVSVAKTRSSARSHLVLDLAATPTPDLIRTIEARGMQVVAYLPLTGVIVSTNGEPDFAGLPIDGFDALQPDDKLSPELTASAIVDRTQAFFVVEFHRDISWEDRRALVIESGLEIRDHQDLVIDHMLVRGTTAAVRRLTEWDEVAYVFPASRELAAGLPLIGCLGGATEAGQVGQLTQRVGEGWDGPGLRAADLTYSFQGMPRGLPEQQVQDEIRRAMAAWSRVVQVRFQRAATAGGAKNINILFGAREHGDPYPFDGAGKVLAHTFYPAPPNPEPIAGDLHFDADESWQIGADIDVFSVALHELGHALGLGHSDVPSAVMYPYYRRATALTAEDVGAIRMLYGASEEGEGTPRTMELAISAPVNPSTTQSTTISVAGTVAGSAQAPVVTVTSDREVSTTATVNSDGQGGYLWQASGVALFLGENRITVTARDGGGQTATRSITVHRIAAPVPPPNPPTPTPTPSPAPQPPIGLEVTNPIGNPTVNRSPIILSGVVTGGSGRPSVRWANDRGGSGTVATAENSAGSYRWETEPLTLQPGVNQFIISAADTTNQTISRTVRITYVVPGEPEPGTDKTPPRITIISPNTRFLMTPAHSLSVRGTASDASGVAEVRWECTCGLTGVAQGVTQWTIPNIGLPIGSFVITVTARDAADNTSTASFTVFRYSN